MVMMEKPILILVSSIFVLVSCANRGKRDLPNQELDKCEIDSTKRRSELFYFPKSYDQSIKGLFNLFDSKSLNPKIFENYEKYLFQSDELFIVNETSYCRLHIANGGSKGEFQTATIGYLSDLPKDLRFIKVTYNNDFKTNNGVVLGMTIEGFYKAFPKSMRFEKFTEGNFKFIRIRDSYETYFANYQFQENKLMNFSIGYSED